MIGKAFKVLVLSLIISVQLIKISHASHTEYFSFPFDSTDAYNAVWVLEGSYGGHQGTDYSCLEGTPVYASITGTVTTVYDGETSKSCIGFGNTIVISDGNYTVRYAHLLAGSIPFEIGDNVQEGWLVGKTSNTGMTFKPGGGCIPGDKSGYHLHYEVRKAGGSVGLNPYATGENLFKIDADGSFHFPKEVAYFEFLKDGSNNPHTCANQPSGSAATSWIYTCTKKTTFSVGDSVWGNLVIKNITKEFCISAQLFKVGSVSAEATEPEWCSSGVEPGKWDRSHLMPWFQPKTDGQYEIRFRVRRVTETGYPAYPIAKASIIVNAPPAYNYTGYGITCSDEPTGGAGTGWVYSCRNPTSGFPLFLGPTIYTLIKLDQVCRDFKMIVEVYKDGVFQWKDEPFGYTSPAGCWNNYYHTFQAKPWLIGNWRIDVYIQTAGASRVLLKSLAVTVSP